MPSPTHAFPALADLEAPDLVHVSGVLPGLPLARRARRHTTGFLR